MSSKKLRFEVFKRDGFKCQYCGRTPPEVILEVDHITPKSKGGLDAVDNLITACFDCNRGKGKNDLKVTPASLEDHFKQIQEKREQMKAYSKFLEKLDQALQLDIQNVNQTFNHYYPGFNFNERFINGSLKVILQHLPVKKIEDAIEITASHFPSTLQGADGKALAERAILYFCGICWNWIKKPESRGW